MKIHVKLPLLSCDRHYPIFFFPPEDFYLAGTARMERERERRYIKIVNEFLFFFSAHFMCAQPATAAND